MPITWRRPTWNDIEPCLAIQPGDRGDGFRDIKSALGAWKKLFHDPAFLSGVHESDPPIQEHRVIGFGSCALVTSQFADSEVSSPRPNITSRIMASFHSDRSALATRNEIAWANARDGIDIVIVYAAWRDDIMSPSERLDVRVSFATGLMEVLAGIRVRRIIEEITNVPIADFHQRSPEFQILAEFPKIGRAVHVMTKESAAVLPSSVGNLIFRVRRPVLRLRYSDQQLLIAALKGATNAELATELAITPSAVKARWRSTFARIEEFMPDLVAGEDDHDGRGSQKRHRVLAYVRTHMEELRPYDWKVGDKAKIAAAL